MPGAVEATGRGEMGSEPHRLLTRLRTEEEQGTVTLTWGLKSRTSLTRGAAGTR